MSSVTAEEEESVRNHGRMTTNISTDAVKKDENAPGNISLTTDKPILINNSKNIDEALIDNKNESPSINSVNDAIKFSISVFASTETEIPFLISSATSSPNLVLGGGGVGSPWKQFHPHHSSFSTSTSHFGLSRRY